MNKIALLMSISALSLVPQVCLASSPHPGGNPIPPPLTFPIIGNFQSSCAQGSASIDVRTVNTGRSQSVVHMETQAGSSVQANVRNLNSIKLSKPIKFDLVSGKGTNLIMVVRYTIPHTNLLITVPYGVPGQPVIVSGQRNLTPVGRNTGTFQVPVGRSAGDIPSQATLDLLYFYQGPAFTESCDIVTNDVNDLNLNGRNVPIDLTTPSQNCTVECISK